MKSPAVLCSFSKLESTSKLIPNPANPNKHPPEQLRVYAKILLHQGWRKPITVSKRSGMIVTGEGAWRTAVAEGWPKVPVDVQEFKSEADEHAHLLADNGLAQMAESDQAAVSAILAGIGEGFDVELAGLDAALAESLAAPAVLSPIEIQAPPKMAWVLVGVPITEFAKVQPLLDALPASSIIKTTANDEEGK